MKPMLIRRLFFCIIAFTLLAGAFTVLPQGHAHAATHAFLSPSCSGDGCTGLDHQSTGCSASATTVASATIYDSNNNQWGSVALRYSSACGTNWTTVTSYIGVTTIEAMVDRVYDGHNEYGYSNQYSVVWSDMVYAPGNVLAYGMGCVWSLDGAINYCAYTPTA